MVRIKSKKPKKQRRALRNIKNHQVSNLFTAPISEALQEVYGIKRIPVRVGDSVQIIKGEFQGIEGKVLSLDKRTRRLTIEEATLQKRSGKNRMIERKEKLELIESVAPKKEKKGEK